MIDTPIVDRRSQVEKEVAAAESLAELGGPRPDAKFQTALSEVIAKLESAKTAAINGPTTVNYTEPTTKQNIVFQIQRGAEKLELSAPGVQGARIARFKVDSEIDLDIVTPILKGFISCVAGNQVMKDLMAAKPTRTDLGTLHKAD